MFLEIVQLPPPQWTTLLVFHLIPGRRRGGGVQNHLLTFYALPWVKQAWAEGRGERKGAQELEGTISWPSPTSAWIQHRPHPWDCRGGVKVWQGGVGASPWLGNPASEPVALVLLWVPRKQALRVPLSHLGPPSGDPVLSITHQPPLRPGSGSFPLFKMQKSRNWPRPEVTETLDPGWGRMVG